VCSVLHNGSEGPPPTVINNKAPGPALRTPYGPGADPPTTLTKEQVLMGHATDPQAPTHDPRTGPWPDGVIARYL